MLPLLRSSYVTSQKREVNGIETQHSTVIERENNIK